MRFRQHLILLQAIEADVGLQRVWSTGGCLLPADCDASEFREQIQQWYSVRKLSKPRYSDLQLRDMYIGTILSLVQRGLIPWVVESS
jgi:hypothetical protein